MRPGARGDRLLSIATRLAALISGGIVAGILAYLVRESLPAMRDLGAGRLLGDPSWHPRPDASTGGTFGLAPMLAGTVAVTGGAVVVAGPLGVLAAVFTRFYAPATLARGLRGILELLAGIPSVVFGLWGLVVLVPWIRRLAPPGASLLAGIVVLALMILPTVAITAEAALAAVSPAILRGAAALGLSRPRLALGVAVPAARGGILTGILLAAGRALGETMAVLMVCGNVVQLPASLFDPVRTLTANIALEMAYALGDHRAALFASGTVLLLLAATFVLAADRLGVKASHE